MESAAYREEVRDVQGGPARRQGGQVRASVLCAVESTNVYWMRWARKVLRTGSCEREASASRVEAAHALGEVVLAEDASTGTTGAATAAGAASAAEAGWGLVRLGYDSW